MEVRVTLMILSGIHGRRIHWIPVASLSFLSRLLFEGGELSSWCSYSTHPPILPSVGGLCGLFQVPAVAPLHHRQAGLGRDGQEEHAGDLIIHKIIFR